MRLLPLLILRLMGVVVLCLGLAIGWLIVASHQQIAADSASTAARLSQHLQGLYWQRLLWRDGLYKDGLLPLPEWQSLATQSLIAPGVCVSFTPPGESQGTLCSQVEALGPEPPEWFVVAYQATLGKHHATVTALTVRDKNAGTILTQVDANAALRLAWSAVAAPIGVAAAMAGGIALLAALMIGHALLPARAIIEALGKLEGGQLSWRLPRFKSTEFNHIARAVNELAARLHKTNAERAALTARLFQVQENERRALARDLHDEFGQSLAATRALAALIEDNAATDRPEIASDARTIGRMQEVLMDALQSTLVRLRSQNIEELGLEASLRQLVADHNAQSASGTIFRLDVGGGLSALHKRLAVDLYRITQECLTNATKHGRPSEVRVELTRIEDEASRVALTVEDDGGGNVGNFQTARGHGLLGIRERLSALGGTLTVANASRGIRVVAVVPLGATGAMA